MDASKPRRAIALVRSLLILADAVATDLRMQRALVHVVAASPPGPSPGALALVVPVRQVHALAAILAGLGGTLVAHLVLRTEALVLHADHRFLAVQRGAVLGLLAAIAGIAHGTVAVGAIHGAGASVQALAIGGIAVDGGQGQGGHIAGARLTVVT